MGVARRTVITEQEGIPLESSGATSEVEIECGGA